MQFEDQFDFDASADAVMQVLTQPACYVEKYRHLRGPAPQVVEHHGDAERFTITLQHTLAAEQLSLPAIARKYLGQQLTLEQTDSWQLASRRGRIDIDLAGAPVCIGVDLQLLEHEAGARLILAFDVRANVPLFGHKIERALEGPIAHRMRADLEQTARMAREYG